MSYFDCATCGQHTAQHQCTRCKQFKFCSEACIDEHPYHDAVCWDRSSDDPLVVGEALLSVLPLAVTQENAVVQLCMDLAQEDVSPRSVQEAHKMLEHIVVNNNIGENPMLVNGVWANFKEKAKATWNKVRGKGKKKEDAPPEKEDEKKEEPKKKESKWSKFKKFIKVKDGMMPVEEQESSSDDEDDNYGGYPNICEDYDQYSGPETGCPRPGQTPTKGLISYRELKFGKELGRGAFGVVYSGTYRDQTVAIKTIQGTPTPESLQEFNEEANLLANVPPHPNVVQFIGITRAPNVVLVTELVDGGGLDSRLKKKEIPVGWNDIFRWALGIAAGIEHLHRNGILHRDLAARNVLVDSTGIAKVTDFGLSVRICSAQGPDLSFQQRASFRGPWKSMPPESLAQNVFSYKSDTWAYGVTLWEIISRRAPFEYMDINQVKQGVLDPQRRLRLPFSNRWPSYITDIMAACWRTQPKDRPNMDVIQGWLRRAQQQPMTQVVPAITDQEAQALYSPQGPRPGGVGDHFSAVPHLETMEDYYDELVDGNTHTLLTAQIPMHALLWSHYAETGEMLDNTTQLVEGTISSVKRLLTQKGRNHILAGLNEEGVAAPEPVSLLRDAKIARKVYALLPGKKAKNARAQIDEIIQIVENDLNSSL